MGKTDKPSKKTEEKKKTKVFQDVTFGMKNKKGKKQQAIVKAVQSKILGTDHKKIEAMKYAAKDEKKSKKEALDLLGYLQTSLGAGEKKKEEDLQKLEEQKVEMLKAETEKTAGINIYLDPRDPDPTRSPKVWDAFMEACEKNIYGWQWKWPDGGAKCLYAHCLPEGFMLKSTMEALMRMQQEDSDDRALEYHIEEERAKIDPDKCTPVNKESFEAWHIIRREKVKKVRKLKDKENEESIRGKGNKGVYLTGRALLKYDATLFKNDQDGDDPEDGDEEEEKHERKVSEGDEDIHELHFGIDEDEEDLDKEIELAKQMGIEADLFDEDDDDVDLGDLEGLE